MNTLNVDLGRRSYPIYIGPNLLGNPDLYRKHIPGTAVMVVTNDTVAPLYLDRVRDALRDFRVAEVVLPDGEQYKTIETWGRVIDALMAQRFDRQSTLLALGGGVIGDITGFAAAAYQRGVHFVQVPTTLLAQVDSSVGGKTGVNHPRGKNMIGAFHQPRCVIADTDTLATLPDRELSAGLAEVIKYGLIHDPIFFDWLERHMDTLLARDPAQLSEAIERSCRDKAEVVAADELEAGQRALLNLGHTFGHAIEAGTGYGTWLHGEAVATGMVLAAKFSQRLGWLRAADVQRITFLLRRARLPVSPPPEMIPGRFLDLMAGDKKVQAGRLRLVLLQGIGRAVVTADFDPTLLHTTLAEAA
jgi:3-dehydroquinate synthase